MSLQSRNIFIDTQYFLDKSLDFQNKEILALEDLVKKGLVKVFITDINQTEVFKKIKEEIHLSFSKVTSSDARYLKAIPLFSRFLATYPEEKIVQFYFNQYDGFIKRCKVKTVSSDAIKVKNIFDDYCRQRPPFNSDSKKNRKAEFPDAFALAAISNWTRENRKKAYVLSGDSDWKAFAKDTPLAPWGDNNELWINSIDTLPEFLDLVIRNEVKMEDLTTFADSLIESNRTDIAKEGKSLLQKCKYQDDSIDLETEIINHYVISGIIDQKEIIMVNRESAVYNLEFKIDLVLKYRTKSYEHTIYDSEDRRHRNVKTYTFLRRFTVYEQLTIEIGYEDGIPSNFRINSFDAPEPIYLNFEDGTEFSIDRWALTLPVVICGVSDGKITDDGHGVEHFENIAKAKEVYPDLDINKPGKHFTAATGNKINDELRFETWKADELYNSLCD